MTKPTITYSSIRFELLNTGMASVFVGVGVSANVGVIVDVKIPVDVKVLV